MIRALENLRIYYIAKLKEIVTCNYVYIDFPMYFNVGDSLITLGSLELLSNLDYKCNYMSSGICLDKERIKESDLIILQGGGNFGDLYRGANEFRNGIIRSFPNNKIVIFPQTIWYNDTELMMSDAEIFAKHPNLTILVRDNQSLSIANKYFSCNNVMLFPDTAIFLNLPKRKNVNNGSCLYMLRKDKEVSLSAKTINREHSEKDWDDILNASVSFKMRLYVLRVISYIRRHVPVLKSSFSTLQNWYFLKFITNYICRLSIVEFLKYDLIVTTRLHGAILSMLLGIPMYIEDNRYNKCINFFSTWFPDHINDIKDRTKLHEK